MNQNPFAQPTQSNQLPTPPEQSGQVPVDLPPEAPLSQMGSQGMAGFEYPPEQAHPEMQAQGIPPAHAEAPPDLQTGPSEYGVHSSIGPASIDQPPTEEFGQTAFDQSQVSQQAYEAASHNIVSYMRLRYSSDGPNYLDHLRNYRPPYSVSMTSPQDALVMDVDNTAWSNDSRYQNWMYIRFRSNLSWRKELQGVGYNGSRSWTIGKQDFDATPTGRWISSNANSGSSYFTQTTYLRKAKFIGGMADMYYFHPSSLWNTLGGAKQVTITWIKDG